MSLKNVMLPLAMLCSLAGCSPQRPDPPPVVVPCPPPRISPELLVPPEHQAMDRLLKSLGMEPVNVGATPNASPPSKPN